jgi:hypothetical protein
MRFKRLELEKIENRWDSGTAMLSVTNTIVSLSQKVSHLGTFWDKGRNLIIGRAIFSESRASDPGQQSRQELMIVPFR